MRANDVIVNGSDISSFQKSLGVIRKRGSVKVTEEPVSETAYTNETDEPLPIDQCKKEEEGSTWSARIGDNLTTKVASLSNPQVSHKKSHFKEVTKPTISVKPHTRLTVKKMQVTRSRKVIVRASANFTIGIATDKVFHSGKIGAVSGAGAGACVGGPFGAAVGTAVGATMGGIVGMIADTKDHISARDVFTLLPGYRERGDYVECEVQRCKIHYRETHDCKRMPPPRKE